MLTRVTSILIIVISLPVSTAMAGSYSIPDEKLNAQKGYGGNASNLDKPAKVDDEGQREESRGVAPEDHGSFLRTVSASPTSRRTRPSAGHTSHGYSSR